MDRSRLYYIQFQLIVTLIEYFKDLYIPLHMEIRKFKSFISNKAKL